MSWEKVKYNMGMSQTMLLDNQADYRIDAIEGALKTHSILFDKVLINRAFVLNNYELIQILNNRQKNGFLDLIKSDAIAFVMDDKLSNVSFTESLEKSKNEMDIIANNSFTEKLDHDIEKSGFAVPYVTFDYSETSKRYIDLISIYYEMLKAKQSNILDSISTTDKETLEDLINAPEKYTIKRQKFYDTYFDIPLRPNRDSQEEYNEYLKKIKTKKGIKQIVDVPYNANIPIQNTICFDYPAGIEPIIFADKKYHKIPPIDDPTKKKKSIFFDIRRLNFKDASNILEEDSLFDYRKNYLDSIKKLKEEYNSGSLEEFIDSFDQYLRNIYEKFKDKYKGIWFKDVELDFRINPFSTKETRMEVGILMEKVIWGKEVIFQMILNRGLVEDESLNTQMPIKDILLHDSGLF
ncbi:hypothetical protein C5S31_00005 [ANME-1 cluster archaeon GoMg2]|nr:hypothetical protein [ANME-1 cluster archaeon GoMg2]